MKTESTNIIKMLFMYSVLICIDISVSDQIKLNQFKGSLSLMSGNVITGLFSSKCVAKMLSSTNLSILMMSCMEIFLFQHAEL